MKRLSIPKLCLQRRRSLSLNLSFYKRNLSTQMERCVNEVDVVIVGAGPAGLSASIKLKQLDPNLSVVILEKASQIGGHSVSGAVLEPTALNELIPNWADDLEVKRILFTLHDNNTVCLSVCRRTVRCRLKLLKMK